ncbi:alginate O-acetyltransferase AlgX-related protein [Desulfatirhabdium butyrativorans]|uniref:alginate O-acetyltransferase AlgX-related protein n=1 Tax=Desulfatirhabdium butyrativorans TaxID=340467 RepID=UPI00042A1380|nr:hypothetical protein [Desulfatirhabdium butyrativorans]
MKRGVLFQRIWVDQRGMFFRRLCCFVWLVFGWMGVVSEAMAGDPNLPLSPAQFRERCRSLSGQVQTERSGVVPGVDGWLFLGKEIDHIAKGPFWGPDAKATGTASNEAWRDPMPAIRDFAEQLKKSGVHLILMPVPPKAVVYPDRLWKDVRVNAKQERLDAVHAEFYSLLRKDGIDILDLTPILLASRQEEDEPLYCQTDSHWSGRGIQTAAGAAATRIRERLGEAAKGIVPMKTAESRVTFSGDLARLLGTAESETRVLRMVSDASGKKLAPDERSNVLILADSHGLVFHAGGDMHAEGAGLFEQLSFELGYPVDLIAVRGSGATPARINLMRKIQRDPAYLQRKKVVLWCFSAREFTESDGWRIVPLGQAAGAGGKSRP